MKTKRVILQGGRGFLTIDGVEVVQINSAGCDSGAAIATFLRRSGIPSVALRRADVHAALTGRSLVARALVL